jgi:glycosyltransferase involved in cell wall biosynthesis
MAISNLGVYVDGPFRVVRENGRDVAVVHPADFPFLVFLGEVGKHFDSLLLFGRAQRARGRDGFVEVPPNIELQQLPYYSELTRLREVAAATPGTISAFWRALRRVDGVWVFGPHPLGLSLVTLAAVRRKRVILGVRQSSREYFAARLPSPRWRPILFPLGALDASFRLLGRSVKTVVAGRELASLYGTDRAGVLVMSDSLVPERERADIPPQRDWSGTLELLTVGRLDAEKNPLLLAETIGDLEAATPGRFRLTWVGGGPLEAAVRERAVQLGVEDRIDLRGWVPFGPELLDLYRRSHVFVHVSLTEGVPRVLFEAMACATPIVATDVGGVRGALAGGRAGLLVPPNDRGELVEAIGRIADDAELRERLLRRGLELVRDQTLEAQAARVAAFIASA